MGYVELHCHSAYSFLDGASQPEELVIRAAELGYEALALTDHDGVYGSLEFAHAAKAFGIRPITGAEVTLEGGCHVTLLVETPAGYANLCRLLTEAHAVDRLEPALDPALLERAERTASSASRAARATASVCSIRTPPPASRAPSAATASSSSSSGRMNAAMRGGTSRCATSQRPSASRRWRPETSTPTGRGAPCSRTSSSRSAIARRSTAPSGSGAATAKPSSARRTRWRTASPATLRPSPGRTTSPSGSTFDLTQELGYRYPDFADGEQSADVLLRGVCERAFRERYARANGHKRRARKRLNEELRLIAQLGLSGFFLLHHEVLELAREIACELRGESAARNALPPGRGRGSSVGSIVCYLTGLSHVDPVSANLSLGRFLNRELASVPDIDLDFPRDIRERLIVEVTERYGREHAALVATFSTYHARGAIRDVGKALGLPAAELERLARVTDGDPRRVADEIARLPGADAKLVSRRWRALGWLCKEIAGLPRHISQHPGGMVISSRPLVELVPVEPAAMEGRQICQWDKDSCADAGFLKIDLLGLGMLSAIEDCVERIATARAETVDLSRIPLDDQGVYEEIQRADTVGTFQIESRAQMQSLLRTRPANLDDLTVQVALVRPGPIQGGAVHPYIDRRARRRVDPDYPIEYDHPLLEEPLAETFGVVVFQDQVLEVAMALAGFSIGEAEGLRRAMSRKRSEEAIEAFRERFVEGAARNGVDPKTANEVYDKLAAFSGFGFPKSHAAAFALLAYQSSWLRRYYPAEFLCALLNAQPMGFYPPASLVRDAQRRGVTVLPPDVNVSDAACTTETATAHSGPVPGQSQTSRDSPWNGSAQSFPQPGRPRAGMGSQGRRRLRGGRGGGRGGGRRRRPPVRGHP